MSDLTICSLAGRYSSLGNQEAPRSILASFREDLVMKLFLRPFSSSSADSRRAVVS